MIYTKPELRERLKNRIMAGSKGGKAGQWSARKAQMLAMEYKRAGGGYRGDKAAAQKSLKKWIREDWGTKSGKPSVQGKSATGERYLPKAAIAKLTDNEYKATSAKKKEGLAMGEQFTKNTKKAAKARSSAIDSRLAVCDKGIGQVKVTKHPGNGFAYVSGTLTRPGIFRYACDDGSWINAVRLPEAISSPEFIATISGSALMLDHPEKVLVELGDPIDGMVMQASVAQDGSIHMAGWITSQEAVAAIDAGVRQLSACFVPDWVDMSESEITSARLQFVEDAAQCPDGRWMFHENLVNNHAAIVQLGRVSGAALDSTLFIKETGMETNETAVDEGCDAMPVTGGEVKAEIKVENVEVSAEKVMSLASELVALAMELADKAKAHGMQIKASDMVTDSAVTVNKIIAHFGVTVPAVLDAAELRLALADSLLSQKVVTVASDADSVDEVIVETVPEVQVQNIASDSKAESMHDILARINKAANKA